MVSASNSASGDRVHADGLLVVSRGRLHEWVPFTLAGPRTRGRSFVELLLPAVVEPGALGGGRVVPTVVAHAQARAVGLGGELERHLGVAEHARPPAAQQPGLVDLEHLAVDRAELAWPVSSTNSRPTSGAKSVGMSHAASSVGIDERPPHPLGGVRVDGFVFDGEGRDSRVLLQVATETVETVVPEPVERVHPLPHLVEALGVEVVATLTPVALLAHEPDPAQHREMLRDRRAAHRARRPRARCTGLSPPASAVTSVRRTGWAMAPNASAIGGAPAGDMPTLYVRKI